MYSSSSSQNRRLHLQQAKMLAATVLADSKIYNEFLGELVKLF